MHLFRSVLVGLALSCPTFAVAQSAVPSFAVPAPQTTRDSARAVREGPILRAQAAVTSTRGHHVRVGAATGALLGAAAGVIGSNFLTVGCTREPCHDRQKRLSLGLWFGSLGAIGGGLVGGAAGAMIPGSAGRP